MTAKRYSRRFLHGRGVCVCRNDCLYDENNGNTTKEMKEPQIYKLIVNNSKCSTSRCPVVRNK